MAIPQFKFPYFASDTFTWEDLNRIGENISIIEDMFESRGVLYTNVSGISDRERDYIHGVYDFNRIASDIESLKDELEVQTSFYGYTEGYKQLEDDYSHPTYGEAPTFTYQEATKWEENLFIMYHFAVGLPSV